MSGATPQHAVQLMEVVEMSTTSLAPQSLLAVSLAIDLALDDLGLSGEDIEVRCFLPPKEMPGATTVAVPVVDDGAPVERLAGFAPRTGSDVRVRADLSPRGSAITIAHELRHIWQHANEVSDLEQDATALGERIAGQVMG